MDSQISKYQKKQGKMAKSISLIKHVIASIKNLNIYHQQV